MRILFAPSMLRPRWVAASLALLSLLGMIGAVPICALSQVHVVTEDGGWWQSLTDDQQYVAVESAIGATERGFFDGIVETALIAHADSVSEVVALIKKADHKSPIFSHTFSFYVSAITDFYVMHSGAKKVTVADVLSCLADNPIRSCATVAAMAQTQ